jgi:hypothetical protein
MKTWLIDTLLNSFNEKLNATEPCREPERPTTRVLRSERRSDVGQAPACRLRYRRFFVYPMPESQNVLHIRSNDALEPFRYQTGHRRAGPSTTVTVLNAHDRQLSGLDTLIA